MSWSVWRMSANHHSPHTSPAVFRVSPPSTLMEEDVTSSTGMNNSNSIPFICHLTCRLRFTLKPIGLANWNQTILLYSLIFCLSVDIRSYWTTTRPPTTSSVALCVGWLFGWTSSASYLSVSSHCSLSSCTIKYLPPMQAWPYHTLCRYVYEVQKKTFLISDLELP